MRDSSQRLVRRAGALLFVALLLVPLLASTHRHAPARTAQPCATCVVAHHSPAVGSPALAPTTPTPLVLAADVPAVTVVATRDAQRPTGRAPPALPATSAS